MRPFIHVNCAMSADGKIAGADRKQVRISSDEDMQRVKNLRRQYDAILVGVGTVIADNPHLTVKGASYDENPVRIVVDPKGRIPEGASVLDDAAPTVVITTDSCSRDYRCTVINTGESISLTAAVEKLAELGIENIFVEGGGDTIAGFFREELVDKYSVFVGNMVIGGKSSPTPVDGEGWVAPGGIELEFMGSENLGDGVLLNYRPLY